MPLQATSGAASYDAFGGGVPSEPNYIESVFSCFLYTGNNSTQTINNGIDLSTKGGLVWIKNRTTGSTNHALFDTIRGAGYVLSSNTTSESQSFPQSLTSFNTNGFSLDYDGLVNDAANFVSWSFRKQPKFFTTVSYTGNGNTQDIAHDLGSVPGFIITKRTSTSAFRWRCYHRSLGNTSTLNLDLTGGVNTGQTTWNSTTPTATVFSLGVDPTSNGSGESYVAYLFAHNAGGFGLTGTDNVISCGSYTGTGSTVSVDLGYEPQWLMFKRTDSTGDWVIIDNMRGWTTGGTDAYLKPNTSDAETNPTGAPALNATGFSWNPASGATFIYIAIRRGPMRVPTSGTSVFTPIARTGTGANATVSGVGFPPDLFIGQIRGTAGYWNGAVDRLRGVTKRLVTSQTNAEDTTTDAVTSFTMDGSTLGIDSNGFVNESGKTYIEWNFRRAPSFFDEVCYTGTEISGQTFNHNLGAVPEMMIVKARDGTTDWTVYHSALGASARIYLNLTNAANTGTAAPWNSTTPTSTVFSLGNAGATNLSGTKFVNYLFATCAGVSKVGSYTGNGSSQTINCGFTGGARFVMVKATSTTGNWIVADSARGIVSGNDPALYLNSTAAEVTGLDWIDADNSGFVVNETATIAANTNGVSYIFLAVA